MKDVTVWNRWEVTRYPAYVSLCFDHHFASTHVYSGMESHVASYPLALLRLMEKDDRSTAQPPLGIARRMGVESSMFNVPAHRLPKALITHAPSQETMAKEFLDELGKCGNTLVQTLGVLVRCFDFRSELILLNVFKPTMCITRFPLWPRMNRQI